MHEKAINAAAQILARSTRTCVSSGSGMSAESGIDTFRDVGGIWDQISPSEVGTVEGLIHTIGVKAPTVLPLFHKILDAFITADPNAGHLALADLEQMGILKTVITQNVDNMHQEAGNTQVVEVHGNMFRVRCLSCGRKRVMDRKPFSRDLKDKLHALRKFTLEGFASLAPQCVQCGGITRPDVVMFGEAVHDMPQAISVARASDVMMVLGTSGVVYPAAGLPGEAKNAGAAIIVINPRDNPFARFTDVHIPMTTGDALPAIVERIKVTAS